MSRSDRTTVPRQPPQPPADVTKDLEQADRILDAIEDDVPERAWDKAAEFLESVQAGVADVRTTIDRTKRVTERQLRALDNWETAVGKWIDPNG